MGDLLLGEALMASKILKLSAFAFLASASVFSVANAGGFGRGTADTDILYEEGNFNLRAGATYVSPTRKYTVNPNPALVGTSNLAAYVIPSAAVKLNIFDDLRCTGTFVQAFGGDAEYAVPTVSGTVSEHLSVYEGGATCGYKFDMSKGRAWILGGIFHEQFDYSQDKSTLVGPVNLKLAGTAQGFRLGAAYEIPEIALRVQAMYRSGSSHSADGFLDGPVGALAPALINTPKPPILGGGLWAATDMLPSIAAIGTGKLPQSFEFKGQSGIAPEWLAFASVKWTDWSVLNQLLVTKASDGSPISANIYNYRDGWTVSAGVGHSFTESFSGAASLTWDRGVGTGFDLSSDSWTLGAGGSLKDAMGGELRFGGGITYITAASAPLSTNGPEASSAGWAYALSASYKTKW